MLLNLSLFLSNAFADGAAPAAPPQPSIGAMLLPFGLMFVVFYFLLIRPQQKKQKEHELLISGIQKGEDIITTGGILGKVHEVVDSIVTLEVAPNVRIKVLKSQIATVQRETPKAK